MYNSFSKGAIDDEVACIVERERDATVGKRPAAELPAAARELARRRRQDKEGASAKNAVARARARARSGVPTTSATVKRSLAARRRSNKNRRVERQLRHIAPARSARSRWWSTRRPRREVGTIGSDLAAQKTLKTARADGHCVPRRINGGVAAHDERIGHGCECSAAAGQPRAGRRLQRMTARWRVVDRSDARFRRNRDDAKEESGVGCANRDASEVLRFAISRGLEGRGLVLNSMSFMVVRRYYPGPWMVHSRPGLGLGGRGLVLDPGLWMAHSRKG
ncbi:hypothetical protein Scep_007724 [Stephania cephalantha]|uniref:Uncharacterized protein n=1 Tax=Stephania cephalantha TaxID=152367 RepID=A0AAP0KD47_9MAGN